MKCRPSLIDIDTTSSPGDSKELPRGVGEQRCGGIGLFHRRSGVSLDWSGDRAPLPPCAGRVKAQDNVNRLVAVSPDGRMRPFRRDSSASGGSGDGAMLEVDAADLEPVDMDRYPGSIAENCP